jgi:phosphoribosyl-AMP cyclohydrolase / phosphoribosyl-ATP pyrophosphohydrolase
VNFGKSDGLVPAIVQHASTREVLMLGYMNAESLAQTRATGLVTFYSRSRQTLWVKGETSGNLLHVIEIRSDCDDDALLVLATPDGPTCHRGTPSCFDDGAAAPPARHDFLAELAATIDQRVTALPAGSYVASLIAKGLPRIAQKVGEEGVETVIAALGDDPAALVGEAADLVFHLMVLLRVKDRSLAEVVALLETRHRAATQP